MNLQSFINIEVAESGQSKEFLHSWAVGLAGSGLPQGDVAARLVVRPRNTPDLNTREDLWEVLRQELDSEEPSTNVQQLTERLKSAWAKIARYA